MKINFDHIFNSDSLPKKPNLFTIQSLKDIADMETRIRKETIDSFWEEDDLYELDNEEYKPDSTILIQFAIEDLSLNAQDLSEKTKITLENIMGLLKGTILPWKIEVEKMYRLVSFLNIEPDEFIQGLKYKTIIIQNKDLNLNGLHLPRAKNLSEKEKKRALLEMEREIAIQDEKELRDQFIHDFNNFVSR